ncbi:MAG: hypothetical protein AAF485_00015 [Chloroflexota bacterium]
MPEQAQALNPETVLKRYYEAMNQGQAEDAYALFAANAIRRERFQSAPDNVVTDPTHIKAGITARGKDNIVIEAWDFQVDGNKVTCMAKVWTDYGRKAGFAPVEERVEVIVDSYGKIKDYAVMVTPESLARMEAAEQTIDG